MPPPEDLAQRLTDGLNALAAAAHDEAWRELRTSPEGELKAALRDGADAVAHLARIDPAWSARWKEARPHLDALRRALDLPGVDDRVHEAAKGVVHALGLDAARA